jgi:hypothetical protein
MGTVDGKGVSYSPAMTNNNKVVYPSPGGGGRNSSCCSRTIKCLVLLVLLVGILFYLLPFFTDSKIQSKEGDVTSWSLDVDSFRETKIIIDNYRGNAEVDANCKHNKSDPVEVIQVTGPYKNTTGHGSLDNGAHRAAQDGGEIPTVFSTLNSTFADLHLQKDNLIPTLDFIHVSTDLRPLLHAVGSSIGLIENDIRGNAKKLMKVYSEHPTECATIQTMVLFDIKRGRRNANEGSVVSLTWYKRAYEFLWRFMKYIVEGAEPSSAATRAYHEVLGKHHNFFVRTTFQLGMKMLPTREDFFRNLVQNKEDLQRPDYEAKVSADIVNYLKSMRSVFTILRDFFTENNLEN